MEDRERKWRTFISYDRGSRPVAECLAQTIEELGHTVWFDRELHGGLEWWDEILRNIRESDVLVVVLTPRMLKSDACKREYCYAADLGKRILPVRASKELSPNLLPEDLLKRQLVDHHEQDRESLRNALRKIEPPDPLPDPLPPAPEMPISNLVVLSREVLSANLEPKEQIALLTELKWELSEPESAEDARTLLQEFRRRRDLIAQVANEIDDLKTQSMPTPATVPAPEVPGSQPVQTPEPEFTQKHRSKSLLLVWIMIGVLVAVIVVAGVLFYLHGPA